MGNDTKAKYIIISPVKNEEKHIEKTITSVISQTIKPQKWIIVNDGSIDKTKEIIQKYLTSYTWIKLINRNDTSAYSLGKNIVDLFYIGLENVDEDYDFIVKLDCDLSFNKYYFEILLKKFSESPRLGMASGQSYVPENNKILWEDTPTDHVKGLLCTYKKECFEDIGGLKPTSGWDTIDEITARLKGWETRSYKELKILHYRKLGSKTGIMRGNIRHGHIAYIIGGHPLYILSRCVYRSFEKPYIIGSLAYLWGYLYGYFTRKAKAVDKQTERFFRREQLKKLFSSKFYELYYFKFFKGRK